MVSEQVWLEFHLLWLFYIKMQHTNYYLRMQFKLLGHLTSRKINFLLSCLCTLLNSWLVF